jgi:AMIN domain
MKTKGRPCRHIILLTAFSLGLGPFAGFAKPQEKPSTSANRPAGLSPQPPVQVTPTSSVATIIARAQIGRSRSGEQTIVRVEGNGRLTCQPHRLNDPERLVLDFAGARLAARRTSIPSDLKPVRGVRLGQFKPNVARVVIDLEAPAADAPYSVQSEGNTLTVAFAAISPGGATSSSVAPQTLTEQEKNAIPARRMETAQQAPALQAAAGIPAMPQPESSTHRATASASPVAPEVKVEFENAFKVGMPSFRAQAQTLPSILGEVGDKSNVAIIVSEGLGDEQVWVQFQDYRQARDLPPIQGLTRRYCTVQPASVSSQPTAVLVAPGEVGYIPKYKDKWMLKVSAAHGRNEDGTPNVDWRMTYGYYDARKKAIDECEKWLSRTDKVIKQGLRERSKQEEKKQAGK